MTPLRLSMIQSPLHWHSIGSNLAMFEEKIRSISDERDLIVLPEMFSTGFTMDAPTFAEPANSTTVRWMKQMATATQAAIVGSYIIKEKSKYFNRLHFVYPDGEIVWYDKRHLFRMADEDVSYAAGKSRRVVRLKGWKILPLICYDLRFPVWSRNKADGDGNMDYDLLLYVANWPKARATAWSTLLQARAVENLAYCAGLNRIGEDGLGVQYNGQSAIYGPKGETMLEPGDTESVCHITLQLTDLQTYRRKFPTHLDADQFDIR